jgi:hypothetical protein
MLIVAVASLADGTNGVKRLRLCRRDGQEIRVYARPTHALAGLVYAAAASSRSYSFLTTP